MVFLCVVCVCVLVFGVRFGWCENVMGVGCGVWDGWVDCVIVGVGVGVVFCWIGFFGVGVCVCGEVMFECGNLGGVSDGVVV